MSPGDAYCGPKSSGVDAEGAAAIIFRAAVNAAAKIVAHFRVKKILYSAAAGASGLFTDNRASAI